MKKFNIERVSWQAMNPAPPGEELDMIGIEQLILIDDLQNKN